MLGLAMQILADALYSTQGVVLLLGACVYLAFFAVDAIRLWTSASHRGSKVDGRARFIIAAVVFIVVLVTMTYAAPMPNEETCAEVDTSEEFRAPLLEHQVTESKIEEKSGNSHFASKTFGGSISKGLRLASAIQDARQDVKVNVMTASASTMNKDVMTVHDTPQVSIETCKSMQITEETLAAQQLMSQLQCYGNLVENSQSPRAHAAEVLAASRKLMTVLHGHAKENRETWISAQVQWARITYSTVQSQCSTANSELRALQRSKSAPAKVVITALHKLKKLENPLKEAISAARQGSASFKSDALAQTPIFDEMFDLHESQVATSTCMLEAIQEARTLATALPRSAAHVRTALQCSGDMLASLESLVIKMSKELQSAGTTFALGMYLSEQVVAAQPWVPFFGTRDTSTHWVAGGGDVHVPQDIALAEDLLLQGEELTSGLLQGDRAAARALRLYQHAKHLALLHHDAASEWRYREAARVAVVHRRPKLASHSLTRLGFFLSLRGRTDEAQDAVMEALHHFEDPLAQYLHVSLRRSVGALTTDAEVRAAENVLGSVAGRLPSKLLEEQRAQDHEEFLWWGRVADGGLRVCFAAQDAAQFLICMLCGFVFNLPLAAPA